MLARIDAMFRIVTAAAARTRSAQARVSLATVLLLALAGSACGQKGPLTLPPAAGASAAASTAAGAAGDTGTRR